MGEDKTLGIDGYNEAFFKKSSQVIKEDIIIDVFLQTQKIYMLVNCIAVTLVPKGWEPRNH